MAELPAVTPYQIVMKKLDERLGNFYQYIFVNGVVLDKSPEACFEIFNETEKIIRSILG